MEYVINPLTGRKIHKDGLIHQQLIKQQHGGNPILAALPTLSQLAIPGGLTLASYYTGKYLGRGKSVTQSGGGGGGNLINNPILNTWLLENKIQQILPTTLVPAGVLTKVYNQYIASPESDRTIYQQLSDVVDKNDLKLYMKHNQLRNLKPHTTLPFAILMGPHVFKQYLIEHS